ncbi:MAG: cryptochrome/photolyase family protein, partial [Halothiobacillaceae bacterium]
MRNLIIVLGDQLDRQSSALDGFDPACDVLWMAEVCEESTHVCSHKARIALFLSAMRHFAEDMRARGRPLIYHSLGTHGFQTLADALRATLHDVKPTSIIMVRAGDWRVQQSLEHVASEAGVRLEVREDRHFIASEAEFERWATGPKGGRKTFRLEHWYRELRKRTGLLMMGGEPVGGQWNFDADNRQSFDARGPGFLSAPRRFEPDAITRATLEQVATVFAGHPGALTSFDWPVTPAQAQAALEDFIAYRLPSFGHYQDAMWTGEPWLYHSRLSAALNLKLIDPMSVCRAAEMAFHSGHAPIEAVEGFIRQILGWREYVRGLYRLWMPDWLAWNALDAHQPLPGFFWTGDTDMVCLREVISQILTTGYAH